MNLLVTGGLGFIASNFIRYMLKKDHEVKITARTVKEGLRKYVEWKGSKGMPT